MTEWLSSINTSWTYSLEYIPRRSSKITGPNFTCVLFLFFSGQSRKVFFIIKYFTAICWEFFRFVSSWVLCYQNFLNPFYYNNAYYLNKVACILSNNTARWHIWYTVPECVCRFAVMSNLFMCEQKAWFPSTHSRRWIRHRTRKVRWRYSRKTHHIRRHE